VCEVARKRQIRDRFENPQDIKAQITTDTRCEYCPIKWKTELSSCYETPCEKWHRAILGDCPNFAKQMARDEVNFLKQIYYDLLLDKIKDPFINKG